MESVNTQNTPINHKLNIASRFQNLSSLCPTRHATTGLPSTGKIKMTKRISNSRSGVTLLFVVSMIVLFLLMGTAFVVVSNDHLKAARKRSYVSQELDNSRQLVEQAFYDLVRGVSLDNEDSPLRTHSILGDMYGYGLRSYVNSISIHSSGQFVELTLQANLETTAPLRQRPIFQRILDDQYIYTNEDTGFPDRIVAPPVPDFLNGHLLTFVSGPAAGMTTRIIEHQITAQRVLLDTFVEHTFIIAPLPGSEFGPTGLASGNLFTVADGASSPDQVVINGRPFAGSGAGTYNLLAGPREPALADQNTSFTPAALMPNLKGRSRAELITDDRAIVGDGYLTRRNSTTDVFPNSESINECYDTFDFQNMFLGGIMGIGGNGMVIPSFHRPELVKTPGDAGDFRAFTSPSFINGYNDIDTLQVDNTNNGTPDGYWMDINLSQFTAEDGKRYQPLVSYFVMDMDGKINVNAHGNQSQIDANNHYMTDLATLNIGVGANRSRGRGYGPAEIDMGPFFGADREQRIMEGFTGDSGRVILGRYGVDGVAGYGERDDWSAYKHFGLPVGNFTDAVPGTIGHLYQSSAMDIWGRFSMGWEVQDVTDFETPWVGMPVANIETSGLSIEVQNSPYETSFAPGHFAGTRDYDGDEFADDALYTPAELQRVLRPNDPDVFLQPSRLENIVSPNPRDRMFMTTDSFEVPTAYENLAGKLYAILAAPNDPTLRTGLTTSADREQIIRANIANSTLSSGFRRDMLAPELRRGQPMNVNRPFGDGVDNDGDDVVDEISVSSQEIESTTERILHPVSGVDHPFDHDFDSLTKNDDNGYLARAIFARQLFMMILLTTERVDRNGDGMVTTAAADWFDFDGDGTTNENDRLAYRRVVAQWCINVVDFRDPDSIRTPFEVDLQPWDGWDVDGDLTTNEGADRHIFWGLERPELVITETMATHDRRTEDTATDPSGNDTTNGGDIHFDSHLLPVASAFFEIYNPWIQNDTDQIFPAELYSTQNNITGVDLQRLAPGDDASPVWRMISTAGDQRQFDPDDPSNNDPVTAVTAQREIYFVKPGVDVLLNTGLAYYPPTNLSVNPLAPGRYAVVGSATAEIAGGNSNTLYRTWFGRRTGGADFNEARSITLDPANRIVEIFEWDGSQMDAIQRLEVIALPINQYFDTTDGDQVRSFGLSDPDPRFWYNGVAVQGATVDIRPSVVDPADPNGLADGFALFDAADPNVDIAVYAGTPAGQQSAAAYPNNDFNAFLRHDGLHSAYKTIHLQRLANPLEAYDPVTNPYLTVDSNAVDLFCFNGVTTAVDPNNTPVIQRFGSFERRDGRDLPTVVEAGQTVGADGRYRMLWKNNLEGKNPTESDAMMDSPEIATDQHILNRNFANSFGIMNDAYMTPPTGGSNNAPFAWLTWNNRPYASALELANVPFTSSYWLPCKFDVADTTRNVYRPLVQEPIRRTGAERFSGRFAHLLNFYADTAPTGNQPDAAWLHRIFDYLEVPSRFTGTEFYLNPVSFLNNSHNMYTPYAFPFDSISHYRNPGKININTITDRRVWEALMGSFYGANGAITPYNDWQMSRRHGDLDGDNTDEDYGNPYRASYAANLVPDMSLIPVGAADCGLFRRKDNTAAQTEPLFENDMTDNDTNVTATKRSAYIRNDMRQRLGNLVTMRSSVFSIWITVGFFEVNPDGTFGAEMGLEEGQTRRHRGFFIFDRSIPVAFEPGKNHNIEKAIRVSSFIE